MPNGLHKEGAILSLTSLGISRTARVPVKEFCMFSIGVQGLGFWASKE